MSDPNQSETVEKPIGAGLAAVLAAAAKGLRPGVSAFVVARFQPDNLSKTRPFDVRRPVGTREEAEKVKANAEEQHRGVEYGIFGPFVNDQDPPPQNEDRVAEITVTTTEGHTFPIPGDRYDALFLSYEAVKKFVLPLYVEEYGPEFAARVLQEFNENPLALMAHLPWSEEVLNVDEKFGKVDEEVRKVDEEVRKVDEKALKADPDPATHGALTLLKPDDDGEVYLRPPSPGHR